MDATLLRRCAAEGLGTALLVVFGPGSLVAALRLGDGKLDPAGLSMVALAFGLVVAAGTSRGPRRGSPAGSRLLAAGTLVVVTSVVVHGTTAAPGVVLYRRVVGRQ